MCSIYRHRPTDIHPGFQNTVLAIARPVLKTGSERKRINMPQRQTWNSIALLWIMDNRSSTFGARLSSILVLVSHYRLFSLWWFHSSILLDLHTSIFAYLHTCILAYSWIPAYLHTCILSYLHTCILVYLHSCICSYLHICAHLHIFSCLCLTRPDKKPNQTKPIKTMIVINYNISTSLQPNGLKLCTQLFRWIAHKIQNQIV